MEARFDSRSKDLLQYAFDLFPNRDYLIVTQPHTVAENSLFNKFTLAQKKSENTFSHVLYIFHRDYLMEQDLSVSRCLLTDLDFVKDVIDDLENKDEMFDKIYESCCNPQSAHISLVARVADQIIGCFMISKDINLEYYKSHFHIQDQILLNEHERKGHTRLIYSVINPIFEKSTRFILKEIMRLTGNTCVYFEIQDTTVIPAIFYEMIHIRSRRFPHFLDRKWDHERYVAEGKNPYEHHDFPVDG